MMSTSDPIFRAAIRGDASALAKLVNFAGEGLPVYLWEKSKEPGETVWDVGRRRAEREEGSFSFRNAVVAEVGGRVVASLVGYPLPEEPDPVGPDMPAMFVPLQELENLAPGTWYVNVLACYPEHRSQGLGGSLLAMAEEKAAAGKLPGLSIIVSDGNSGARRLYERSGYRERASRPMVKDGWSNPGKNWLLLIKEL
jgi:ribosomal protein S18 acetylase RimI-like enzyme